MSELGAKLGAYLAIGLMRFLAILPLSWVRALGWLLGSALFYVIRSRRRVAEINLTLCFQEHSKQQIRRLARQNFVFYMQALLDRGWLWHGSAAVTLRRLKLTGDVGQLQNDEPVVLFVPHFVGLDAGNTAFTQQIPRKLITIYTNQANKTIDAWILKRKRLLLPCAQARCWASCRIWALALKNQLLCRFMASRPILCHRCIGLHGWVNQKDRPSWFPY
jgi:lauroyl/myristoyl acyltransferase